MKARLKYFKKLTQSLNFSRVLSKQFASGLFAMLALGWLLRPEGNWSIQPEPLVVFLPAFVVWVLASIYHPHGGISSHDQDLLQKIRDKFDADVRMFLREHDFGGPFERTLSIPLLEVARSWQGADFDFDDPEMQEEWSELQSAIGQFSNLLAHTYPLGGSGLQNAIPERERDEGIWSERTKNKVKEMNDLADKILSDVDALIKIGRSKRSS